MNTYKNNFTICRHLFFTLFVLRIRLIISPSTYSHTTSVNRGGGGGCNGAIAPTLGNFHRFHLVKNWK